MTGKLDSDIKYVKGVGPKRAEALNQAGIATVWDLLNHFPRRYLDRSHIGRIRDLRVGDEATIIGRVENFGMIGNRKSFGSRFQLTLSDESGSVTLIWFRGAKYFEKAFAIGETLAVFGKVDFYGRDRQIAHPEIDRLDDEADDGFLHTGSIIPLYPSSELLKRFSLDSRGFRKLIHPLLDLTSDIPESLSPEIIQTNKLLSIAEAYRRIHFPQTHDELKSAQGRIKFEELFYLQLMLAYRKSQLSLAQKGIAFTSSTEKVKALVERLPFTLTDEQKKVLREIYADMRSPHPMNRLIQGDVGSGKTIVAILSMLTAVEHGYQTAFMAPTEILAEQHYFVLQDYLWGLGVHVVLIKGKQKKSEREKILEDIRTHQVDIVVGTHAIFQESVEFSKLGLIVIDEQHRFGVMQRAEMRQKALEKGIMPDILVMTATPIPRTLAMAIYGDLDVSVITELPTGRKPIKTASRKEMAREKIYTFVREEIQRGRQVYIVYPLIEESEKSDLKAATEAFELLSSKAFKGLRLGLLHGKMKSADKQGIMAQFKAHTIDILVSTTVIEVGVNVPNATIMLIEHAERFGLTQLHQLRGRVGRGGEQSYCILMIGKHTLMTETEHRLNIMEETTDGFRIAEEDLKIRGPGEFFGTRQSGLPELKLAHILYDRDILQEARTAAFALVKRDPHLREAGHKEMRLKFEAIYRSKLNLGQIG